MFSIQGIEESRSRQDGPCLSVTGPISEEAGLEPDGAVIHPRVDAIQVIEAEFLSAVHSHKLCIKEEKTERKSFDPGNIEFFSI